MEPQDFLRTANNFYNSKRLSVTMERIALDSDLINYYASAMLIKNFRELASTPERKIVLELVEAFLAAGIPLDKLQGSTPVGKGIYRGTQISEWLYQHHYWSGHYVILDDMPSDEFKGLEDRLVQTNEREGLTKADCQEVLRVLSLEKVYGQ